MTKGGGRYVCLFRARDGPFQEAPQQGQDRAPRRRRRSRQPVCGDMMTIMIRVKDDRLDDIKFETLGCGAAMAVSSIVTEMAKGKTLQEALQISTETARRAARGAAEKRASLLEPGRRRPPQGDHGLLRPAEGPAEENERGERWNISSGARSSAAVLTASTSYPLARLFARIAGSPRARSDGEGGKRMMG